MTTTVKLNSREPVSKSRLRLWLRLLKLTSGLEAEVRRRLRDKHDTTLPRFDVMAALARYPDGLKMSELSGYLKVSNGNVTGIVDRLTDEGLTLRVSVPNDRRAQLARLTPKGLKVFEALAQEHEAWIDELLGDLSKQRVAELMSLIERVKPAQSNEELQR